MSEHSNASRRNKEEQEKKFVRQPFQVDKEKITHLRLFYLIEAQYNSLNDFAHELGTSPSHMHRILRGIVPVTRSMKERIARELKLDSSRIFDNG